MTVKKSKLAVKKTAKTEEVGISKKSLLTIIGIVLVLAIVGTVALIWTQADFVAARINRIPIRQSEVLRGIEWSMPAAAEQGLWPGTDEFNRAVREDAVRQIAIVKLFEDYANQLGLALPAGTDIDEIVANVVWTILADPDLFARYEPYMPELPEVPEPRDFEAIANDVLARARAGEDFDALMWEYSQDPGLEGFPDGYTFAPGQFISAFEEATRNLEYGEISDLVWAVHNGLEGFHIIKRIPPNPDEAIEGVEMLGAKHILIQEDPPFNIAPFREEAVINGFFAKVDTNIEFRPALNRVPVQ